METCVGEPMTLLSTRVYQDQPMRRVAGATRKTGRSEEGRVDPDAEWVRVGRTVE